MCVLCVYVCFGVELDNAAMILQMTVSTVSHTAKALPCSEFR